MDFRGVPTEIRGKIVYDMCHMHNNNTDNIILIMYRICMHIQLFNSAK